MKGYKAPKRISGIEVIYNPGGRADDPLNLRKTIGIKVKTDESVYGDFVELPDDASIEDAIAEVNAILRKMGF